MINYVYGEQLYESPAGSFKKSCTPNTLIQPATVVPRPVVVLMFKNDSIQAEIDKWTLMAREPPDLNIPKTIGIQCLTSRCAQYNLSDRSCEQCQHDRWPYSSD